MGKSADTLYGNVPDKSRIALLLIDVINDFSFPEGEALLRNALPMARALAKLKRHAREHGCPSIYVNDNFGRWRSDFKSQVEHCMQGPGHQLAELLHPEEDDYFVLKPAHSAFYSTSLELLLKHVEVRALIITGMATNICVLFSANDAFIRGYELYVPSDCVAANTKPLTTESLKQMKSVLKARIGKSGSIPWSQWKSKSRTRSKPQ